jgi:hypothetical protein
MTDGKSTVRPVNPKCMPKLLHMTDQAQCCHCCHLRNVGSLPNLLTAAAFGQIGER